jgi:addiction module HigA family antidote
LKRRAILYRPCGTDPGLAFERIIVESQGPYQRIDEIINGQRGMTPSTALRLEKFLGMSSNVWMDLQLRYDLYRAHAQDPKELESIEPYTSATAR